MGDQVPGGISETWARPRGSGSRSCLARAGDGQEPTPTWLRVPRVGKRAGKSSHVPGLVPWQNPFGLAVESRAEPTGQPGGPQS